MISGVVCPLWASESDIFPLVSVEFVPWRGVRSVRMPPQRKETTMVNKTMAKPGVRGKVDIGPTIPRFVSIADEVSDWYTRYSQVFIDEVTCAEPNPESLLDYYAIPMWMVTPARTLVADEPQKMFDVINEEFRRMLATGYASAHDEDRVVRVLDERSVIIEATWVRYDRAGEEIERNRSQSTVVRTDKGWRIAIMSNVELD
ncbi:DUF6841 family protein [Nocardia terpenica]|uniref:DUF6841 family protein n=1 Tax=Nocardia terpenica TaxID=455432 RepID=UPI0012FD91B9|nr:hypothetical protein [Nocardia terpenica]